MDSDARNGEKHWVGQKVTSGTFLSKIFFLIYFLSKNKRHIFHFHQELY